MLLFWIFIILLSLIAVGALIFPLLRHPEKRKKNFIMIAVILVVLPAVAVLLYLKLGASQKLAEIKHAEKNAQEVQIEIKKLGNVDNIIHQLEKTVNAKSDSHGWYLLGNLYLKTQRFKEAINAFAKANALKQNQPDILLAYAMALYFDNHQSLNTQAQQLLNHLLTLVPHQIDATHLLATDAYQHKNYAVAIHYWETLLPLFSPETEEGKALLQMIAQAQQKLNINSKQISHPVKLFLKVELLKSLKNKIQGDETLFIYAQSATGSSVPLAITRRKARDLPLEIILDDSMAMLPNINLSTVKNIRVIARISKTGQALKSSGDLEGSTPVFNIHHHTEKILIIINK